ncbi:MAG TPA: aminodeoxychorismate/anthranilate synthase component II [Micromonosporaceae bacterium]|nr:aminodeoxychorismate/anthranilate synthase component II [Micromonosporaceae bacterium]
MNILVIDNYDSFVYNLVQYLGQLGASCSVKRNDEITVAEAGRLGADGILLSPGPGTPESAGICMDVISTLKGKLPIFGVCLGHQAFGAAFGATVNRAPELLHGKTSQVNHDGDGVLSGLPSPFTATRYHSLAVVASTLPEEIEITGRTDSGVVMAMRHRELPVEGVQFHPESVLTEGGHRMLANWLAGCGHPVAEPRVAELESAMRTLAEAATHP